MSENNRPTKTRESAEGERNMKSREPLKRATNPRRMKHKPGPKPATITLVATRTLSPRNEAKVQSKIAALLARLTREALADNRFYIDAEGVIQVRDTTD